MQIGEIAERLKAPPRTLRYILEEGIVPTGVDPNPGRGEHRDLDVHQTFWLAMVVVLKQSGLKTPLAGAIAGEVMYRLVIASLPRRSRKYEFDWSGETGGSTDEARWYAEVGDLVAVRLVVQPPGQPHLTTEWETLRDRRQRVPTSEPLVTIRVDLTTLASILRDSPADS